MPYHSSSIIDLNGKKSILPQKDEEGFSPGSATAQPMRNYHNSASEKPLHSGTSSLLPGLFVCNSPSQLSPYLYKRTFLSFVF